jgi:hypothetical protein
MVRRIALIRESLEAPARITIWYKLSVAARAAILKRVGNL